MPKHFLLGVLLAWCLQTLSFGQSSFLVEPAGPYKVGRTQCHWTDSARPDVLSTDPSARRELLVWLWYPADPKAEATNAEWAPGKWGETLFSLYQGMISGATSGNAVLKPDVMRRLLTHSYSDAPVSVAQKKFPVLVFAPGFDQLPLIYADLVEDIASHGYIVAGIVVTHFGPVAVFPDGRVVPRANPDPQALGYRDQDDFMLNFAARIWAADMRFVLNQLKKLNADSSSMFKGRLDMRHLGTFGHSFGGATAAQVALEDSRVKAAIDIDGKFYGAITQKSLGKPFLLVLSASQPRADFERLPPDDPARRQHETLERDFNFVWKGAKPGFKLSLPGTAHMFSSDAALVPSMSPSIRKTLAGSLDVKRAHVITKAYVEAFFDRYLKGKPSLLLSKPSVDFPEATFETNGH